MERIYLARFDRGHAVPLLADCCDEETAAAVERACGFERVTKAKYVKLKAWYYTMPTPQPPLSLARHLPHRNGGEDDGDRDKGAYPKGEE